MADKVTTTKELKLMGYFADGDGRQVVVDNPRNNVTAAEINAVGSNIKAKKLIIGDKGGADFVRFTTAQIVNKTVTNFDLR